MTIFIVKFNIFCNKFNLNVTGEKGLNMRLIFESQRYDRGLEKMVPCSQNVKVIEDHHHMKDFYMSYRGREIYLPIEQSAMERNIYYKTTGDGKPLQITEQKPVYSRA